jgi:hypothetical protein
MAVQNFRFGRGENAMIEQPPDRRKTATIKTFGSLAEPQMPDPDYSYPAGSQDQAQWRS